MARNCSRRHANAKSRLQDRIVLDSQVNTWSRAAESAALQTLPRNSSAAEKREASGVLPIPQLSSLARTGLYALHTPGAPAARRRVHPPAASGGRDAGAPRIWRCVLLILAVLSLTTTTFAQTNFSDFENGFLHPPDSTRPWVNWFWLDGNITKEGITADLEAMKRVGLGGALLMSDVSQQLPSGSIKFGSEEWYALLHHAISEAERLGL